MLLSNKIAVVTGATGGLGPAVAKRLFDEGANLVLIYFNEKELGALPEQLHENERVLRIRADVTKEEDVKNMYEQAKKKYGGVDIVCNIVGGYGGDGPIKDLELSEWNRIFTLNLTSCFLSSREALRNFRSDDYGRIINISAKPGIYPQANRGAYAIAKGGVVHLTKIIGKEIKKTGITANAIAPSVILTEANKEWGKPEDIPHWVTPEQIADLIVFLCKEDSKSINGTVIETYGGV